MFCVSKKWDYEKNCLLLIGFIFLLISCDKHEDNTEFFNAVVIGKGLDCRDSFLIKVNGYSGLPNTVDDTYYEINLPKEFKVEGKEIKVEFREPRDKEFIPCTTLGPGYSLIYIISAESR